MPSATARPCESLPPNVATTMSGSTSGSLRREFGLPVEEVGTGQAGRHLVVEFGVDDVRAVEQRLQVRAERARVAVADDVHLGLVGRRSADRCPRARCRRDGRGRHRVDGCGRRGRGGIDGTGHGRVGRVRRCDPPVGSRVGDRIVTGGQAADDLHRDRTRSATTMHERHHAPRHVPCGELARRRAFDPDMTPQRYEPTGAAGAPTGIRPIRFRADELDGAAERRRYPIAAYRLVALRITVNIWRITPDTSLKGRP